MLPGRATAATPAGVSCTTSVLHSRQEVTSLHHDRHHLPKRGCDSAPRAFSAGDREGGTLLSGSTSQARDVCVCLDLDIKAGLQEDAASERPNPLMLAG